MIFGKIIYKEKTYPFVLDGRRVYLIGGPYEYTSDFKNAESVQYIIGFTSDNQDILFLNCGFRVLFSRTVSFSIKGYLLSNSHVLSEELKYGTLSDFSYEKISFFSEAINAFFPPQDALSFGDIDFLNWNGEATIKIKPISENAVVFKYRDSKCEFNIPRYLNFQRDATQFGTVKSSFSIEHSSLVSVDNIANDYLSIYDFLSFVNFNSNIPIDEIYLYRKQDEKLVRFADVHIFSNSMEYGHAQQLATVTADDFSNETLSSIFSRIASLREQDNKIHFYFPKSKKERNYITPEKWLISALSFDGLFEACYKDFKQNSKNAFRTAKRTALDALNNVDKSQMKKSERQYFEKCYDQIDRYEGLLEEKFNHVCSEYREVLGSLIDSNKRSFKVELSEYGKYYAEYRNKIAHGTVEDIKNEEIAVFMIMRALIYILLLKDTLISKKEMTSLINKLFS